MLVQIILFDGFDLLDAIAPYEVLTAAGDASGGGIAVELVSATGARAVPSGPMGLPIPAGGRPDLDRADIILIPGRRVRSGAMDRTPYRPSWPARRRANCRGLRRRRSPGPTGLWRRSAAGCSCWPWPAC